MPAKLVSLLMIFLLAGGATAQTATAKDTENAAKLEKEAVEFLRETASEVGNLRSMENRISFDAELASLMWFHDEKEAKGMYGGVVSDFKQLVAQFDSAMNTASTPGDDDMDSPGGFFGGYGRSKIERKFHIAMAVRQQIAMSLAEHAPDLAYNFFYDSLNLITNPQFRKETERADRMFEAQLLAKIAAADPGKGVRYGKESIKSGIESSHVELLKKIYDKDADKGIDFGAELLSRIKSDKSSVKGVYVYSSLLTFGMANLDASKKANSKKPVFSQADLRDIAEQFAQFILDSTDGEGSYGGYASLIERFSPSRAAQVRAKYKSNSVSSNGGSGFNDMANAANTAAYYSNTNSNRSGRLDPEVQRAIKERQEKEKAERQLADDVTSIGSKSLSKEDRDKVIAETRKIIAGTPGKAKKIASLSMLAGQVAKAGDRELAGEIMRDVEALVDPQPKNYQDYLFSWMLCAGYAEADPNKAFPMLEGTIRRANDTISAFIKVAEFIDVNDEIVVDGEVQVGMFGGSMVREMTGELGMASDTIRSLANADFTKTKELANSFDRNEIRVLAKMMVLRAVLDKRTPEEMREKQVTADGLVDTEPVN
jgi:hypothetical protein